MRKPGRKTPLLGLVLLVLFLAPSVRAVPIVRLEAPATVTLGQAFAISIYVDGLERPDSLLRFGFNFGYQPSVLSFTGFSVAAPFHDDTPNLGGPYGGSIFPGLPGNDILLGSLNFTAVSIGLASLDIGDQNDAPLTTGLFTTLNPDRYRIIGDYVDVHVIGNKVPDASPTIYLLALSVGGLALLRGWKWDAPGN